MRVLPMRHALILLLLVLLPALSLAMCANDIDCPSYQRCDAGSGQCVEKSFRCISDVDCGAGYECDSGSGQCLLKAEKYAGGEAAAGRAKAGCTSKADCEAWEKCNVKTGKCIDNALYCLTNADCEVYEKCERKFHSCILRKAMCGEDWQCDSSKKEYCDASTHRCKKKSSVSAKISKASSGAVKKKGGLADWLFNTLGWG